MSTYETLRDSASRGRDERLQRARGGRTADEKQDEKSIAAGVHKHERHDHPGKPLTKLKAGGKVEGRARGGRLDRGGKKPVTVNVVVAGGGSGQGHPVPVPVPVGGPAPGGMPPHPPIAGMGPGAPPPGGMPPGAPPPGMMPQRKRGGSVKMTAGAASGEGRMQKERMVK